MERFGLPHAACHAPSLWACEVAADNLMEVENVSSVAQSSWIATLRGAGCGRQVTGLVERMKFRKTVIDQVANLLGGKSGARISDGLAKTGLRGLGVNIDHEFEKSGEAWLMERTFSVLRSPVCADIGANVGEFSLRARKLGAAKVLAFEPAPETFRLLTANTAKDHAILCRNDAVGEKEGETSFFIPDDVADSTLASRDMAITAIASRPFSKITVPVTTLDAVADAENVRFDILKIDVEGYELDVLLGARAVISAQPALIQFEFNSHHMHRRHTMLDFAQQLPGYALYRLAHSSLRRLDPGHYLSTIYTYQNIIAIHERADELSNRLTG